jgi:hypothetical protein
MAEEGVGEVGSEPAEEEDREEGPDVGEDELARDSGEGWEGERDGTGARHGYFLFHHRRGD